MHTIIILFEWLLIHIVGYPVSMNDIMNVMAETLASFTAIK